MATDSAIRSLLGRSIRWTFSDGPTAGTTYEHTFHRDGTVSWRSIDDRAAKSKPAAAKPKRPAQPPERAQCATVRVAEGILAASYLAASGYTLTVVLNFQNHRVVGFASNDRQWFQQKGKFQLVKPAAR